jgi:subtilisin family serine protease
MIVVQRAKSEHPGDGVLALKKLPEVKIVEPNIVIRARGSPNDPDYGKLWALKNTGAPDRQGTKGIGGVDTSAENAWRIQTGSKNVIVAVIDTGVNYRHPDLADNMWVNSAEATGASGVDDDGNGYIDDIHGFNFVKDNGDPLDDHGHGSHCAGTIGAVGNNGLGVVGLNWNVSIMAIKFLDSSGAGTLDQALKALAYASKSKAQILSNSWGGNINSELLKSAVGETERAGQVFIAAAGNDGANNDAPNATVPASYPFENIVAVGAVNNRGELASFSNYGVKSVHLAAPGVNILSTVLGTGYETMSGTSMATPHVSGVAALLLANQPGLSFRQVKERLMVTARPLASLRDRVISPGIVDAYYALTGLTPPPDPNDPTAWTSQFATQASTEHPYPSNADVSYTITVPGAKRISVHFAKFETEKGYDKAQFSNAAGESFGSMSGNQTGRFGPIVDGDTVIIRFTSDRSVQGYGFDVDYVVYE